MVSIIKLAPANSPSLWLCINFVCCLWSVLLVVSILSTMSPLNRLEGTQLYFIWNFGTTLVWCIEAGLNGYYARQHQLSNTNSRFPWTSVLEVALAIYFTADSIHLFRKWLKPDQDIEGELADTIVSTLAYAYQLYHIWFTVLYPSQSSSTFQEEYTAIGEVSEVV